MRARDSGPAERLRDRAPDPRLSWFRTSSRKFWWEGGRSFVVARYVRGRSLRDLASGLDALHAVGLVHHDVKPSSVILDEAGKAPLTDFGLAKASASAILAEPGRIVERLDD